MVRRYDDGRKLRVSEPHDEATAARLAGRMRDQMTEGELDEGWNAIAVPYKADIPLYTGRVVLTRDEVKARLLKARASKNVQK